MLVSAQEMVEQYIGDSLKKRHVLLEDTFQETEVCKLVDRNVSKALIIACICGRIPSMRQSRVELCLGCRVSCKQGHLAILVLFIGFLTCRP